ncbi:MAG: histidine--tRNA ligase [Verrucomicrobia bacterium CG_4_10_14_3_um_filter_43_23]|nr:MAG: histidine--tRNA ligase [Verrucomicrobia bacterium CG1_02_43_26]PIP58680.1 MAG: histidine--tRNA ligase [Verrucomicrobia bacterium CG22_combo_CG10-13_8_21_14_all_43_17]PIX58081.1 MAG: histidine--tRNA ligase [Verrucomicrobia bacterium CG_4_10_14_3_um_filter_43_23]PIY61176.1 MAG: histidine--tRNA ligase [Verrucomicrobia bacterium CG_4_10_14_0_8_um_filter_43_34]PJA43349.1 MAG: histidine--tRNA ligase [Verrucomicrobia bacterium CG_4_9_14_3_um_filter_43_20]
MAFNTLPGFREFYPEECSVREYLFSTWRQTAKSFNFHEFDAPVLEPLELFTVKSGDEIVGQLFNFEDKGGRAIALRPEMTPSLARLVGAKANSMRKPVKWFNVGEHFRYERPQKGRLRSFYQFNADILGEESTIADAEAITLLIQILSNFGLTDKEFCIRLSDRDIWVYYLIACGLSDEDAHSVLTIIDKMEREDEDKVLEQLKGFFGGKAAEFLKNIKQLAQLRSIVDIEHFFNTVSLAEEKEAIHARIASWRELLGQLDAFGVSRFIRIDLSIVRGLAYYTGFVFEAFQTVGQGRALAGGGRYDNLVKKLANVDMPAVGFAMGDVTLLDLLKQQDLVPACHETPDVFVVIDSEAERDIAFKDILMLRALGIRVDFSYKNQNISKQLKQANQLEAKLALVYGATEVARNEVLLKDLDKRTEENISRDELIEAVSNKLAHLV